MLPAPSAKVRSSLVLTIANSSVREYGEVLAQVVDDRLAGLLQLGLEQVGHQRHAAAAAGAGLGAALERVDRVDARRRGSAAQIAPLVTLLHEQT